MKTQLTFLFLLYAVFSNSQTPGWTWAKKAGGTNWEEGKAITSDQSGNVYVAGLFTSQSITFGNDTLTGAGGNDVFIAKYDSSGNLLWAKKAGGLKDDVANAITTDFQGNVFIAGGFASQTISFGSYTLIKKSGIDSLSDQMDIFLAKYDSAGNVAWAKSAGGKLSEQAFAISTDVTGKVFISGYFESDTVVFDSDTVFNPYGNGFRDIFVSAFDPYGNSLWAKYFGDYGYNNATCIGTDPLGNIYLSGYFAYSSIRFGNDTLINAGGSGNDVFITKLDPSGNVIWARGAGGINSDYANALATDANSNVFITGLYGSSTITFGGTVLTQSGSNDIFLAKYDFEGNMLWAKKAGSGCSENSTGIAINDSNEIYITGRFADCYSTLFDTIVLNHTGWSSGDVFIAKYNSSGKALWAKGASGNGEDAGSGIAAGKSNSIFITGGFRSSSISFSNSTLVNAGGGYQDIFLAKISSSCSITAPVLTASDTEFCQGDTVTLSTGGAFSYLWSNSDTSQFVKIYYPGTFSVTVFDSSGCSMFTSPITLTANPNPGEPYITPDSSVVFCGGGTLTSTPANNYLWSDSTISQSITVSTSGNYSVTVTNIYGCFAYSPPVSVIVNPNPFAPIISPGDSTSFCDGDSITLSSSSALNYLWNNGDTAQSISVSAPGTYFVTIYDSVGCSYSASISITELIPDSATICLITADSLSQFNIITWDKTLFVNTDSFIVYREISTANYQPIAAIPFNSLSQFTDTVRTLYFPNTGDPNSGTYRYKIQVKDSCGNYGQLSPYHNTLFILNNNGVFSWPQLYTIENANNPASGYILMRDDSSNGNWHPVNSVAGTQQFITDPQYSQFANFASWRISTSWDLTCTPAKSPGFSSSLSNIYTQAITSVPEHSKTGGIQIFPNPTRGDITVSNKYQIKKLEIHNILGELLFLSINDSRQKIIQINLSGLDRGFYFLSVTTETGIEVRKIFKD